MIILTSIPAALHSAIACNARPRRIDETDEADERGAAGFDIVEFEASRAARRLRGERDDALAAARELVDFTAPRLRG